MKKQLDTICKDFTKNILGLARKNNIDFQYAGNKGDWKSELARTMKINNVTFKKLLTKSSRAS